MSETEPQFKGPAIAVVVPVHNGAAFLQQCLASLAAQTFGDFACFVVDDGSTDESAELAAAWESRDARFVVIHQRQSGVAAARAARHCNASTTCHNLDCGPACAQRGALAGAQ